ncbi:MAG: hypothetical protein JWO33_336 [Caulobacteraceae bacterium]|nr:hypothetical protein [Caulobacteraceae bacterium]
MKPDLPESSLAFTPAVRDLAMRLGAGSSIAPSAILTQTGRMKRTMGSEAWMSFTATQTISAETCDFDWRGRIVGQLDWRRVLIEAPALSNCRPSPATDGDERC